MRLKEIDLYYMSHKEPIRGCLLALRYLILQVHPDLTESWKYKTPCFDFQGKMCCYLWIDKKTKWPYVGIVKGIHLKHPALLGEGRKQIRTYLVNPEEDIAVDELQAILNQMVEFLTS